MMGLIGGSMLYEVLMKRRIGIHLLGLLEMDSC
jgi:hypothetical protein